jgi:hypothetical protein
MSDYLYYWKRLQDRDEVGTSVWHFAGNQLAKLEVGDELWLITCPKNGRLTLRGHIRVYQKYERDLTRDEKDYTSQYRSWLKEAVEAGEGNPDETEPWDANCQVRVKPGAAELAVDRDITHLVPELRFNSKAAPHLDPRKFTAMNVRTIRNLTLGSVLKLRTELDIANAPLR